MAPGPTLFHCYVILAKLVFSHTRCRLCEAGCLFDGGRQVNQLRFCGRCGLRCALL